jgi:intein/homing endonuclease
MKKEQKEIIKELKQSTKMLGHSPTRREVPKLARQCCRYFGSFNRAKQLANLEVRCVRIVNLPVNAFKIDKDLARIASYLTFDGHIYNDLKAILYSSKNIEDLKDFEKIITKKFGIKGKYRLNSAGSSNQTHQFYVFNKRIATGLFNLGIPKGDKVIHPFLVPEWIKKNKELSREYLKIAYLCEGSMKEKRKNPRININVAKADEILSSGFQFMDELREMLFQFGIRSTECSAFGERVRKRDNKISKDIRFRIQTADNDKFIKEIGWLK